MNTFFKIGIIGGLAYGAYRLFGMKRASDNLVTTLHNPRVHSVDLRGMAIRTEVNVANPTKTRINITKPVITLSTKGKYITSTMPENKEITIQPLTNTRIDTIEIIIPWTTLGGYIIGILGKIPQLVAAFQSRNIQEFGNVLAIPLEMKYSLYANSLFYESAPQKLM